MESLFNEEYYKIFKSTYFEEHLRTTSSENVFMKLRKSKNCSLEILTLYDFQHQYQKQVKMSIFIS